MNTPIDQLIEEASDSDCDYSDLDDVLRHAESEVESMRDGKARCLLHVLAVQVKPLFDENMESARLLGMGAQREARLLARLEESARREQILLNGLRRSVLALAAASERDANFKADYTLVSDLLDTFLAKESDRNSRNSFLDEKERPPVRAAINIESSEASECDNEIIIGDVFYFLTGGRVLRFNGTNFDTIHGYDQHGERVSMSPDEYKNLRLSGDLKILNGVRDFPNSPDPRLPYEFDLNWDVKTVNDLRQEFKNNVTEQASILDCLRRFVPEASADLSGDDIPWESVRSHFREENNRAYQVHQLDAVALAAHEQKVRPRRVSP